MTSKTLKRIEAGLLCAVMMVAMVFASVDVRAEEESIVASIETVRYSQKDNSLFYEATKSHGGAKYANNYTDEQIVEDIRGKLGNPDNLSDSIVFQSWDITISTESDGGKRIIAKPQYSVSSGKLYNVTVRYAYQADKGWHSYYTREVEGIVPAEENVDAAKGQISEQVNNAYVGTKINDAGELTWDVTMVDSNSATAESIYAKNLINLNVVYMSKQGDKPYMMTQNYTYLTMEQSLTENQKIGKMQAVVDNMRVNDEPLNHYMDCTGWEYTEVENHIPKQVSSIREYNAMAQYATYPLNFASVYLDGSDNTRYSNAEMEEPLMTPELFDPTKTLGEIVEEKITDEKVGTVFEVTMLNGTGFSKMGIDDQVESLKKKLSDVTVKELIGLLNRMIVVSGKYDGLALMQFYYPNVNDAGKLLQEAGICYVNSSSVTKPDDMVGILQGKGILKSLEAFNSLYGGRYTGFKAEIKRSGHIMTFNQAYIIDLIEKTTSMPTISGATPFIGSTKVTITADSGDTIYYTIDGTTPTTSSNKYTSEFTINKTTTIKAIAVNANKTTSDVATKEFTIMSSGGGSYSGGGSSSGGSSGGGGGSSSGGGSSDKPVDPTPAPTPDPTPAPTPAPTPEKQDASEYTNSATGEVILDKIVVPETDEVGTKITKKADGSVVVSDAQLGSSGNVSPAVFAEGQVYRLYNPNTGEHFYTKNPQERDSLASVGWNYEADQTSKTIASTEEGAKPVYRVYNPNSGLHHYTTNKDEAVMLKGIGWNYEGISMYAYDNNSNKGTVTYRVYCPFPDANGQNQHIYTTSAAEVAHLVSLGYQDEGTAWRVK